MIDLPNFSDGSRVWVYTSNRLLDNEETEQVESLLSRFAKDWVSHNQALKAEGKVIGNLFVVLIVDETNAGASGCSIDASVHFLKALQGEIGIDLFDRMNFSYYSDDAFHVVDRDTFSALYEKGEINDSTLVANTLVKSKAELEEQFLLPLKKSWHRQMV